MSCILAFLLVPAVSSAGGLEKKLEEDFYSKINTQNHKIEINSLKPTNYHEYADEIKNIKDKEDAGKLILEIYKDKKQEEIREVEKSLSLFFDYLSKLPKIKDTKTELNNFIDNNLSTEVTHNKKRYSKINFVERGLNSYLKINPRRIKALENYLDESSVRLYKDEIKLNFEAEINDFKIKLGISRDYFSDNSDKSLKIKKGKYEIRLNNFDLKNLNLKYKKDFVFFRNLFKLPL